VPADIIEATQKKKIPRAPPPPPDFTIDLLYFLRHKTNGLHKSRGAGKSLARPTSRCILFDGENISFDASLVIYT
jgi:hypothetical protein